MNAILTNENSHSEVTKLPIPDPKDNEMLIKTKGCGICGTDILKINLKLLTKPTVLGHEYIGEVVSVGSEITGYKKGDLVVSAHHVPCFQCHYCNHKNYSMCSHFKKTNFVPGGFSEYIVITKEHADHSTFKIPQDMDWKEAVFTEPLACCVRNIHRLPLKNQDTVLIIGLGSIGLMMASLLNLLDCHVIGIDLDEKRCKESKAFGVNETFTDLNSKDFLTSIEKQTNQRGLDGIIFTAGPATLLPISFKWLRNGGFINLFSHLSGEKTEIDTADLYHKELQIITTYSASPDSLKEAFEILKNKNLNLKRMYGDHYKPQEFDQALKDIADRKILKAMVEF